MRLELGTAAGVSSQAGKRLWMGPPGRGPHIGYVSRDEYELQFADIFSQIVAFAAGAPINMVNPQALDPR